jgi:precorrin-8X/cobalt-precorrin-8 methylmutase
LEAEQLKGLVGFSARAGGSVIRLSPWRALYIDAQLEGVSELGLITDSEDPLLRIEACPGSPACRSASVDGSSVPSIPARYRSMSERDYIRDGAEIYRRSFAIIRAEADLTQFSKIEERVAVRIVHACGMTEIVHDLRMSPGFADNARWALIAGAPILCDSRMVANGITRARLPAGNEIVCTLDDPSVPERARKMGNTRSAAAMELWRDKLQGAVVAIGNAPTSLFRLLELLDEGVPPPAAVIGLPVGFVGARESKEALAADRRVPFLIVKGRKGGSAMAVAAVNALASETE